MISDIDEILLTAYALDELTGDERAIVAARLAASEESRRFVADIRATAHLLSDELGREDLGGLSDLQHASIESKLAEPYRLPQVRRRAHVQRDRFNFAMSIAASVAIVCGFIGVLYPFVYGRIGSMVAGMNPSSSTNPSTITVNPPPDLNTAPTLEVVPETSSPKTNSEVADAIPTVDPPVENSPVPFPDSELVTNGSGHEQTSDHSGPLAGVCAPGDLFPSPTVARNNPLEATGNNIVKPADPKVAARPPHPAPSETFVEKYAKLLPDQQAPDPKHPPIPAGSSSASTSLPAGEAFAHLVENPFIDTAEQPVSGFSAGVDTASYSNIRRYITHQQLPPKSAIRIEEMINYFPARELAKTGEDGLAVQVEIGSCPWEPKDRLARVCVNAAEIDPAARPSVNLVFVIDISESMKSEFAKLPLIKQAMHLFINKLSARDHIAVVGYEHEAGLVVPPTYVEDKQPILAAVDHIENVVRYTGGQGIELAYDLAVKGFTRGGINRIVLITDGNWNVGSTNASSLKSVAALKSREGVSLTVLGVGMTNLKDATLQSIALAGNGSYAFIDTPGEARKVLSDQINGSLVPMARDVKVKVTFNPAATGSYRLIGYERRALSADELDSHSKPGGELGAGQTVTALYQIRPIGNAAIASRPADLLTAAVSYVDPNTLAPRIIETVGRDHGTAFPRNSNDFRFSASVAEFGLLLHDSDYKGNATYLSLLNHAQESAGIDVNGYRQEFLGLIRKARALTVSQ